MDASNELLQRFQGTILGCAIGDALGFPYEGLGPDLLWEKRYETVKNFREHSSGYFPKGQFSDDTQLTLALIEAIIERNAVDGAIIAQHFAKLWEHDAIIGRGLACDYAIRNVMRGVAWDEAGAPEGRAGNGTAMRASPIGLWNYLRIGQILEDSRIQSVVTHHDPRATAGATAIATAVALNLEAPEFERRSVSEKYLKTVGNLTRRAHDEFGSYVPKLTDYLSMPIEKVLSSIRNLGYPEGLQPDWPGIAPFVIPSVMIALFAFLRSPTDFSETVSVTIGAGGDVDTTSAIAGAISGAYNGIKGLPANLRDTVVECSLLQEKATTLYKATMKR